MSLFDWFRPYPQLERVIVNLNSGTVFRGLIWRKQGPFYVMREVEMLSDRDSRMQPKETKGEVLVKLADIDFIQVL